MKLVVFGTSEFAVPVLEAVAGRHDVLGVVTQPDRPAGRGHKLVATPVKRAAEARGLHVFTPEKLTPFAGEARALGADAFVVASYGKIVPQALLDLVPIAFNVHPSMLPLYRGATPLQSAIRDGLGETGLTVIAMDSGMDTGDVLLQERAEIGPSETYGELHDRLAKRGAEMAVEALNQYGNGKLERRPQGEIARESGITEDEIARTLTRPLRKEDLQIDPRRSASEVVNLVRALAPQPLARTTYLGESLKIVAAHAASTEELTAMTGMVETVPRGLIVLHAAPFVYVATGEGAVVVDRLIAPNRGASSGEAFARQKIGTSSR